MGPHVLEIGISDLWVDKRKSLIFEILFILKGL